MKVLIKIQAKLAEIFNKLTELTTEMVNKDLQQSQASTWNAPMVGAWLCIIGLEQYLSKFLENGVDGLTLLSLKNKQYGRCLGIENENHAHSMRKGLDLLKSTRIDYSNWEWSCDSTQKWLNFRGLGCISLVFKENAVHGGVLFSFTKSSLRQFLSRLPSFDLNLFSPLVFKSLWYSIVRAKKTGNSHLFPEKFIEDWGEKEISTWLKRINLSHLEKRFSEHGVNGTALVRLKQRELFSVMGLTELQAKVIMRHVKNLRRLVNEEHQNAALLLETPLTGKLGSDHMAGFPVQQVNIVETLSESTSISTM